MLWPAAIRLNFGSVEVFCLLLLDSGKADAGEDLLGFERQASEITVPVEVFKSSRRFIMLQYNVPHCCLSNFSQADREPRSKNIKTVQTPLSKDTFSAKDN